MIIWGSIDRMVRSGSTPQIAIDRIYAVYGRHPITHLIKCYEAGLKVWRAHSAKIDAYAAGYGISFIVKSTEMHLVCMRKSPKISCVFTPEVLLKVLAKKKLCGKGAALL